MDLNRGRDLAERALKEAASRYGRPICVAVCDDRGLLVTFLRMEGSPFRSVDLAQAKAYTAARQGVSTAAFHARLQRDALELADFVDPRVTGLAGGSVLKDADGVIRGGIGISGLTADEDQDIADRIAASV